jgi:hypothetical protein
MSACLCVVDNRLQRSLGRTRAARRRSASAQHELQTLRQLDGYRVEILEKP